MEMTHSDYQLYCRKCGAHHDGWDYLAKIREAEQTWDELRCTFSWLGCETFGLSHR
jgi:hypothetical protein